MTGFLCIKAGNKGTKALAKKDVYCLTAGSTLHCYKSLSEIDPLASIELKGCSAEKTSVDPMKKTIELKIGDNVYLVKASGDEDCAQWVEEFKRVASLGPEGPPPKEAISHKKMSKAACLKKGAAGKIATTAGGKTMTRKLADEETLSVLRNLKVIIKKDSNMKKAYEIENDIMKIGMKCFFLIDNKIVDSDVFLEVDGPIRRAFDLIVKVWDKKDNTPASSLRIAFNSIEGHLRKAEQALTSILLPHLQAKSINRIKNIFSYVGRARFLRTIMLDNELDDEVHILVRAIEYYTQFHHHK